MNSFHSGERVISRSLTDREIWDAEGMLPTQGWRVFLAAHQERYVLADLDTLTHGPSMAAAVRNEEKQIGGFIENAHRFGVPVTSAKNESLHLTIVVNGTTDRTIERAQKKAADLGVRVRMGKELDEPPSADDEMVLDIDRSYEPGKVLAILQLAERYKQWGASPPSLLLTDGDCRFTETAYEMFLEPRKPDDHSLWSGRPYFYALLKGLLESDGTFDTSAPWDISGRFLAPLSMPNQIWNEQSDSNETLNQSLVMSGTAIGAKPEDILNIYHAINEKAPEAYSQDPFFGIVGQLLGSEIKIGQDAKVWTAAHRRHSIQELIRQCARWEAGHRQTVVMFGRYVVENLVKMYTPETAAAFSPELVYNYVKGNGELTMELVTRYIEAVNWLTTWDHCVQGLAGLDVGEAIAINRGSWPTER